MKVLDTTILIDILRGRKEVEPVLSSKEVLLTTQINMFEVIRGLFYKNATPTETMEAKDFFEQIRVLPLDDYAIIKAAEISAELAQKGLVIEDADCLVAGCMLSKGQTTIVTKNKKHFERMDGIKVELY